MIIQPVFFERNRVRRVYTGGKLFHGFFGDECIDNFFPEEWIASAVKAVNKDPIHGKEGISRIVGSEMYFDELLREDPSALLGTSEKLRILVKILDSAVRLPAQAHPDKAFSQRYFQSEYGKTESWIILDTRPGAKIYFGFKDGVTRAEFEAAVDASMHDKSAMERLMMYSEPKVGDVFLVPAKTIHAIGAGCLILEVQEPTDFTIQPEYWCDEYRLDHHEMFLGLSREDALGCFNFGKAPFPRILTQTVSSENGVRFEKIISEANTDCFAINRVTLHDGRYVMNVPDSYGVYIVTAGIGTLRGENYARGIKKGDYFFMPACLMNRFSLEGSLEVIECY